MNLIPNRIYKRVAISHYMSRAAVMTTNDGLSAIMYGFTVHLYNYDSVYVM